MSIFYNSDLKQAINFVAEIKIDNMENIQQSRSLAPDLARGFILLLIAMAYTDAQLNDWDSLQAQNDNLFERTAIFIKTLFRDNRSYPMFAFLFGYGSVLLFKKMERNGLDKKQILKLFRLRAFWLFVFGFLHSVLVFSYEILAPYGIALLISAPLLFKTDKKIRYLLQVLAPIFFVLMIGVGFMYALPPEEYGESYGIAANSYAEMVMNGLKSFPMSVLQVLGYPIIPVMIIGMLFSRMQLLGNDTERLPLLKKISLMCISISVIGAVPLLLVDLHFWQPDYQTKAAIIALHLISGVFGGIGYVCLFGILSLKLQKSKGKITLAISALGRRSLTGYLLQSIIIMLLMSSFFGNLRSDLSNYQSALLGLVVWLAMVVFSYILEWKKIAGPFDNLLRKLVDMSSKCKS